MSTRFRRNICVQSDSLYAENKVAELLREREPVFQCNITQTTSKDDSIVIKVLDASCHNLTLGIQQDVKDDIRAHRAQGKQVILFVALDGQSTEVYSSGTKTISDYWLKLWEGADLETYHMALDGLAISVAQKINESQISLIKIQRQIFDYWGKLYIMGKDCELFSNVLNRCIIESFLPQNILERRLQFYRDADKLAQLRSAFGGNLIVAAAKEVEKAITKAPEVVKVEPPVVQPVEQPAEKPTEAPTKAGSLDFGLVKDKFTSAAKGLGAWSAFGKATSIGKDWWAPKESANKKETEEEAEKNWTVVDKADVNAEFETSIAAAKRDSLAAGVPEFAESGNALSSPSIYGPRAITFIKIPGFNNNGGGATEKSRGQPTVLRVPQSHSTISNKFRGKLEDPLFGILLVVDADSDIGSPPSTDRVQYKLNEFLHKIKLDNAGYKVPLFVVLRCDATVSHTVDDLVAFQWRSGSDVDVMEWMQWFSQLLDICESQAGLPSPTYNPLPALFSMTNEHDWELLDGAALPCYVPDEIRSEKPTVVRQQSSSDPVE